LQSPEIRVNPGIDRPVDRSFIGERSVIDNVAGGAIRKRQPAGAKASDDPGNDRRGEVVLRIIRNVEHIRVAADVRDRQRWLQSERAGVERHRLDRLGRRRRLGLCQTAGDDAVAQSGGDNAWTDDATDHDVRGLSRVMPS
jgi:hypothetical protein